MSTPTTRLRLELQALGSGLNTWGVQGLNGIFNVLDESLGGVKEITLTGDHTLTTTNYTSNESRFRNIKFIGSPGSAPTITIPATENWYLIENACGQTITISNSVTTGTLANGVVGYVRTNGGSTLSILPLLDQTNGKIVADNIDSVNTVAGQITPANNIATLAGINADITTVATPAYKTLVEVVGESAYKALVEVVGEAGYKAFVETVGASAYKALVEVVGNAAYKSLVEVVGETNYKAVVEVVGNAAYKAFVEVVGESAYKTKVEVVADATYKGQIEVLNDATYKSQLQSIATSPYKPLVETVGNAAYKSLVEVVGEANYKLLVETVGASAYKALVEVVGESVYKGKVETVGNTSNMASVNTVANSMTSIGDFAKVYQVSTNNPTARGNGDTPILAGDLAYITSSNKLRTYNATLGAWEDAGSSVSGLRQIYQYVATANQTVFPATGSISYDQTAGGAAISIFLNGVLLKTTDYTATNGTSITLASGAALNDEVTIHTFGTFNAANTYSQSETNTLLAAKAPLASPNFSGTPQISGVDIATTASIPAAGLSTSFVAQGTIGANVTVGLRSDGKVEVITGVTVSKVGPVVFDSNGAQGSANAAYYDPDQDKIVVIYRDAGNSNYPTVIVGSLSSTTITFPSGGVVMGSYDAYYHEALYDPDTNMGIVVYQRGDATANYALYSHQVSVSGNTPTVHPYVVVNGTGSTYNHNYIALSYNTSADKVLITYMDYDRSNTYMAKVGTVDAGYPYAITWAAEVEVTNENALHHGYNAYNATVNAHLITYTQNNGTMSYRVGTISGTTLTLGSQVLDSTFTNQQKAQIREIPSTSNFLHTWCDSDDANKLKARVVSVSGTTPTGHTAAVSVSTSGTKMSMIIDPDQNQAIVVYDNNSSGLAEFRGIQINGTTVTIDAGFTAIDTTTAFANSYLCYDTTNDKIRAVGRTSQSPKQGVAFTFKLAQTNINSFIGFSNASATNGNTLDVTVKGGVASGLSGLTVLSDYYVQSDGSVSTTSTAPAIKIGTALSATKIGMIGFS